MADTKSKENAASSTDVKMLAKMIGYAFSDASLLVTALTHRSVVEKALDNRHGLNNERLEFLGDAVLSLVTANYLYAQNVHFTEGDLSRLRAQYVCEENLATAARSLNLGRYIKSDKAMRASGSTNSKAILADAVEAIIGAVFIDGGLLAAQSTIFHMLGTPSTKLQAVEKDPKTKLQEIIQANTQDAPKYVVIDSSGPPHSPTFVVAVTINNEVVAQAAGDSKKSAAQNAAVIALEKIAPPQDSHLESPRA